MRFDITSKFEINIDSESSPTELVNAGTFAVRNRCPAVVVPPVLIPAAIIERSKLQGNYKIIAAIDFGITAHYALDKFKDLSRDVFAAEGYDVMLTEKRTNVETINEMRVINEFLRERINPLAEIRYVLNAYTRSKEEVQKLLAIAKNHPPAFIRTGAALSLPKERCDAAIHASVVKMVKSVYAATIKISGNVDLAVYNLLKQEAARFDVSMTQAMKVLHEASIVPPMRPKDETEGFMKIGYSEEEAKKRSAELNVPPAPSVPSVLPVLPAKSIEKKFPHGDGPKPKPKKTKDGDNELRPTS
ncbi:MAG: hypothetical protein Q8K86_07240 [Candidatus Nanopelagicaceae bacterium]|nr:hypothetical protein [Candidatus Nanopelagicaceae bacterium]